MIVNNRPLAYELYAIKYRPSTHSTLDTDAQTCNMHSLCKIVPCKKNHLQRLTH